MLEKGFANNKTQDPEFGGHKGANSSPRGSAQIAESVREAETLAAADAARDEKYDGPTPEEEWQREMEEEERRRWEEGEEDE